jgi:glycerol-3-phosphate dehydrogenase
LIQHTKLVHLEDLVRRRSNLIKLGRLTPGLVEELASILQEALGWSEAEREGEIAQVLKVVNN